MAQEVMYRVTSQATGPKASTVAILLGTYAEQGENHGRPTYQKTEPIPGHPDLKVFIYFWDTRDGLENSGWWFGDSVGGTLVWARAPLLAQMVPPVGWKVPWDAPAPEPGVLSVQRDLAVVRGAAAFAPKARPLTAAAHGLAPPNVVGSLLAAAMQQAPQQEGQKAGTVYVAGLPSDATEEELAALFSNVGAVEAVQIYRDESSGLPLGHGFCDFYDASHALLAVQQLQGSEYRGSRLSLDRQDPRAEAEEPSGTGWSTFLNGSPAILRVTKSERFNIMGCESIRAETLARATGTTVSTKEACGNHRPSCPRGSFLQRARAESVGAAAALARRVLEGAGVPAPGIRGSGDIPTAHVRELLEAVLVGRDLGVNGQHAEPGLRLAQRRCHKGCALVAASGRELDDGSTLWDAGVADAGTIRIVQSVPTVPMYSDDESVSGAADTGGLRGAVQRVRLAGRGVGRLSRSAATGPAVLVTVAFALAVAFIGLVVGLSALQELRGLRNTLSGRTGDPEEDGAVLPSASGRLRVDLERLRSSMPPAPAPSPRRDVLWTYRKFAASPAASSDGGCDDEEKKRGPPLDQLPYQRKFLFLQRAHRTLEDRLHALFLDAPDGAGELRVALGRVVGRSSGREVALPVAGEALLDGQDHEFAPALSTEASGALQAALDAALARWQAEDAARRRWAAVAVEERTRRHAEVGESLTVYQPEGSWHYQEA
ncbi:unnamed protein product [Prorocentrum cordatum]|uniref:RRM domain-containing protein n=2 Tax=Prorocentrum cordatum TaxID=2364126 RepID=A0ABN9X9T2_9DINO|nr:unnamed protein product [Polarella glacialis]